MFFPIVCELFVELSILVFSDVFWLLHPKGLVLVDLFEFSADLLNLLLLLVLLVILLFLDFTFLILWLLLFLIIRDFLLCGLLNLQFDGESNEFGVLLD